MLHLKHSHLVKCYQHLFLAIYTFDGFSEFSNIRLLKGLKFIPALDRVSHRQPKRKHYFSELLYKDIS